MAETTRERLIQASAATFMARGLAASGLKQIVTDADATIGSLYHFFPGGKDELAAETLRVSGAAYQALVEAVFDAEGDVVAGVRACFEGAAEALLDGDFADACPVATVALEVASSDEALRSVTQEIFEHWQAAATSRFEDAGIAGAQARDLATTLIAGLEGGFLLSRAARDTAPMVAIGRSMTALVEAAVASV